MPTGLENVALFQWLLSSFLAFRESGTSLLTVQSFDRIVVLNHGRIIDDGPPDVLAARPGLYRDLLARQLRKPRVQSVPA